jgi:hypothetical protein
MTSANDNAHRHATHLFDGVPAPKAAWTILVIIWGTISTLLFSWMTDINRGLSASPASFALNDIPQDKLLKLGVATGIAEVLLVWALTLALAGITTGAKAWLLVALLCYCFVALLWVRHFKEDDPTHFH